MCIHNLSSSLTFKGKRVTETEPHTERERERVFNVNEGEPVLLILFYADQE